MNPIESTMEREVQPSRFPFSSAKKRFPFLGLLFLALSGCGEGDGYPDHLRYETREDRIVEKVPAIEVDELEPHGELDQHIAQIDSKGGKTHDPNTLPEKLRKQLQSSMQTFFGTPAQPRVTGSPEIDSAASEFGLDSDSLSKGSTLFRSRCQQCHGVHGDGRGPTGLFIQPHPRDFRAGIFKFVSTEGSSARKPSRDDLRRTLQQGIKGTSMPSFAPLADADKEALIAYVIHLSIRGQVERSLLLEAIRDGDEILEGELKQPIQSRTMKILNEWKAADQSRIPIQSVQEPSEEVTRLQVDYQERIRRGYELFVNDNGGGCLKCHTDFGRQAKYRYDEWGSLVKPMDLTLGIYRGGDRPVDHFWRLRGGIGPSGMPALTNLTEEQIWDLVSFLQALPYPRQLPQDIRSQIYK